MRETIHRSHPGARTQLITAMIMFVLVLACEKLDLEPEPFQYPLSLQVNRQQSINQLTWSQATVSTFEEYIILRSTEPIADSPEPEIDGFTTIIARLDQRNLTTFKDVNTPIVDTVYYKVYARIGERMIMSPTVAHDQHLLLINTRSDRAVGLPDRGQIIGVDRSLNILYLYDYLNEEMIKTRPGISFGNPMMQYNQATNEVLVFDNSSLYIYDASSLQTNQSFFPGTMRDARITKDWIYIQKSQFPYPLALYSRTTLAQVDEATEVQTDWRRFFVNVVNENPFEAVIYDFGAIGSAKYGQVGSNINTVLTNPLGNNGGSIIAAQHPLRDEFVITNTGYVVDENLEEKAVLTNGSFGFSLYAYSPDGKYLYGLTFINGPVLMTFDVENDYGFIEEHSLSNQVSPVALFTDNDNVYLLSQVFVSSSQKTLVTVIPHP